MQFFKEGPKQQIVKRRWLATRPDGTSVYRWEPPSGRKTLARIRMLLSALGELGNIGTNYLDHAVRSVERVSFRQQYLPNRLKQYRGQKRLVAMLHGYAQGRPAFETMERVLSSPIFEIFPVIIGYRPYSQDIHRSAKGVRHELERIRRETDVTDISLIGHSQGGLVIRDLLQRQDYTRDVRRAVFLATPHMGTWAGVAGFGHRAVTKLVGRLHRKLRVEGESAIQMLPKSDYLRDLNGRPLPQRIAYTNIYNYLDPLVWPARYARLPYTEAQNVLVMKIGHLQTLYDLQELEIILRALLLGSEDAQDFAHNVVGDERVLEERDISGENAVYEEIVASSS